MNAAEALLNSALVRGRIVAGQTPGAAVRVVLDILTEAGLILTPEREDALRTEGRTLASAAILDHIRRRFPPPEQRNPAQRTYVRHLDTAARIALPRLTLEQAAQALEDAIKDGTIIGCNPPDCDPEADRG